MKAGNKDGRVCLLIQESSSRRAWRWGNSCLREMPETEKRTVIDGVSQQIDVVYHSIHPSRPILNNHADERRPVAVMELGNTMHEIHRILDKAQSPPKVTQHARAWRCCDHKSQRQMFRNGFWIP
jgi:hypothetical protein